MSDVSVITIVRNRPQHLARLMAGLVSSTMPPRELIVVDMSDSIMALPASPLPTRHLVLQTQSLALAKARNAGAREAVGRYLLFLDVDCIPRSNLVGLMQDALHATDALICPEVRYLGPNAINIIDEPALDRMARPHPARAFPTHGLRIEPNMGLFWSLTFGIRRTSFEALGGFDEGYEGYGAEDTDFGYRAGVAGLLLLFLGGTGSFHQYHGVISPPLQHVTDIVRNATRFHARWGFWPMDGWLTQFAELGVVAFDGTALTFVRAPTPAEIAAATQLPDAYF